MTVTVYDTTLRDGSQREGISLSVEDKLRICARLDDLGVHYIEGGFPGSNPKDDEFFERARALDLSTATLVAFGSTCHKDVPAEDDPGLRALVGAGTPAVCVFGKAWDAHVTETLRTTLEENLRMVRDTVAFLKAAGKEVFFDAEHFFDGYARNTGYALAVCREAVSSGADAVVLCDTNGGTLPQDMARLVREAGEALPGTVLGVHAHNDGGCAVANSLVAVEAGCRHVQGTMNGYGERAGNADLTAIIPALALKMGLEAVPSDRLVLLTEVAHFVTETANVTPDSHQPYVGSSAFAHKGGVHAAAADRLPEAYEHVDPLAVGNMARVVVSELAGRASLMMKAREMGIDLEGEPEMVSALLEEIKRLEHQGYSFEVADGSLGLLILKARGSYRPLFELESFDVMLNKHEDGRVSTDAIVRILVDGRRLVAWAEALGPVDALSKALRQALDGRYPGLERIDLTDYKVRVLDEKKGTAAVTRVLIESTDGVRSWGTIGVSENIIEASWEALVGSIEFGVSTGKRAAGT